MQPTAAAAAPLLEETAAQDKARVNVLHASYFEAIFPEPPIVCGLRLKPLSIGRYRLMARFKVAFVAEDETMATVRDLVWGALICSMDCRAFAVFSQSKKSDHEIRRWLRKFGFFAPRYFQWPFVGQWLEKLLSARINAADAKYFEDQTAVFQQYIADGSKSPPYFDESPGGRLSGAHWSHSIEAVLREHQGWTREEIDEEPLTKALYDFYKHMEGQGIVRLLTEAERLALETPMPKEKEDEWAAYFKAVEAAKAKEAGNA